MESSTAEIFAGDRHTRIILCPLRAFVPDLHKILPLSACVCASCMKRTILCVRDFSATLQEQRTPFIYIFFSIWIYIHKIYREVRFRVYAKWIFGLWKLDGPETYYEKSQLIFHIFFIYTCKADSLSLFFYIRPQTQKSIKNYYIVCARKNDERKGETFPVWFSTSDA